MTAPCSSLEECMVSNIQRGRVGSNMPTPMFAMVIDPGWIRQKGEYGNKCEIEGLESVSNLSLMSFCITA